MIKELLSDSKHARDVWLPVNYVLRNAHLCIHSGEKLSHMII